MTLDLNKLRARFRANRHEHERAKAAARASKPSTKSHSLRSLTLEVSDLSGNEITDRLRLQRLADNTNWTPQAIVVVGQDQCCANCGHRALTTGGFFIRETHKIFPFTRRLRSVQNFADGLPVEVATEGVIIPRCVACCDTTLVDELLESILKTNSTVNSNQLELFR